MSNLTQRDPRTYKIIELLSKFTANWVVAFWKQSIRKRSLLNLETVKYPSSEN